MSRRSVVALVTILVLAPAVVGLALWLGGRGGGEPPALPSFTEVPEESPFGVFLDPRQFDPETRVRLAVALGAHYYRSYPILLPTWDGGCLDDCEPLFRAGLEYYLTVRNTPEIRTPAEGVTDLDGFREEVGRVIEVLEPGILAVENEEDGGFFNGTPEEYVAELQAGCEVAHSMDVPCSNGGITHASATFLVYQHLVESGRTEEAEDFAQRAFQEHQHAKRQSPEWDTAIVQQIDYIESFILNYKDAGADYINFHWYSPDTSALTETARYLEEVTGLPAVSNEFGAVVEDGQDVEGLMETVLDVGMDAVIWYSKDIRIARSLVETDGTVRSTGQAFAQFVQQHFVR